MECRNCPKWQGTKYSEWGDCYWVPFVFYPELFDVIKRNGFPLRPPLDPHDFKYLDEKPDMNDIPLQGIYMELIEEEDVTYDSEGNERKKKVKVPYFRTHHTFNCDRCTSLLQSYMS